MKYLHTMVRVSDLDASLKFYCEALGLREVRRTENETRGDRSRATDSASAKNSRPCTRA